MSNPAPLLEVQNLKTYFPVRGGIWLRSVATCKAVDGVSFQLRPGETLGLVGESGCGKSTLGKSIVRLLHPTEGAIRFEGTDLATLSRGQMKPIRRHLQMIFQDPAESLNARHTVAEILEEPFIIHGIGSAAERAAAVARLLTKVGLPPSAAQRYPFEFSGGQRQRIGIARALYGDPRFVVLDEPNSNLDAAGEEALLVTLAELKRRKATVVIVAHRPSILGAIDKMLALRDGALEAFGPRNDVIQKYTARAQAQRPPGQANVVPLQASGPMVDPRPDK